MYTLLKKRYKKINIYSPSHTNTLAALCPVKEGLQFWSHRARSQFPHVSSNTNIQPWEQTCQTPLKKKKNWDRESKGFTEREREQECKCIKLLIPQEHHACKLTVCLGCADSLSVMRYGHTTGPHKQHTLELDCTSVNSKPYTFTSLLYFLKRKLYYVKYVHEYTYTTVHFRNGIKTFKGIIHPKSHQSKPSWFSLL